MCYGTSSGTPKQLLHFGPLIASFLIIYITSTGFYCLMSIWPPNSKDPASIINFLIYITWPLIIFYNYLNAVFIGPGFVPDKWRPNDPNDEKFLQYCHECNAFKAPRSHHCKKCKRCVLKMDHHCPWINTCCGHKNHAYFVYFLFYAPLGCLHATMVLGMTIYRIIFKNFGLMSPAMFKFNFIKLIFFMFALGMAIGVAIAVGILFFVQIKCIWNNQTGIESWIVKKAHHRRKYFELDPFIYPYNLGIKENFRQVFDWSGGFKPIGNGITWNIISECDQYTLTREQLSQKEEKREQSIKHNVIESYDGSFFALKKGIKTCCCIPWTDEPRLPLNAGEIVLVTRCQKHWYYGHIANSEGQKRKGWFPRKLVEIHEDEKNSKKDV